ncbi:MULTISPECIES: hypothetical protein [unclassified Microcoleus]|uniref:hypothetical protein n=1 Tax=unclassified Microcoleus TaxID=2642155 RepID=UPI002FD56117
MKWLIDDEFFGTEVGTDVEDRDLNMIGAIAQNSLSSLATTPDFLPKMQVAFGNSFDVEKAVKLASAWAQGDFSEFPEIEIRSEAEINGALGAFAAATGKIYLSREFLAKNAGNVTAVAGVLREEFGHFVDSQINRVDAIGDEGEIFSDLVQGKALSQGELAGLKGEDDSAVVVLDEELRAIEQANGSNTCDQKVPVYVFYINGIRTTRTEYNGRDWPAVVNLVNQSIAGQQNKVELIFQNDNDPEKNSDTYNQSGIDPDSTLSEFANNLGKLQKFNFIGKVIPQAKIVFESIKGVQQFTEVLREAGGGDVPIQSILQGVSPFADKEGAAFTNDVINKIKNIDSERKNEAKETCCDTPQPKFLIISHSQCNFFA